MTRHDNTQMRSKGQGIGSPIVARCDKCQQYCVRASLKVWRRGLKLMVGPCCQKSEGRPC